MCWLFWFIVVVRSLSFWLFDGKRIEIMKLFLLYLILNDIKFDFMCICWVVIMLVVLVFIVVVGCIVFKGFNYVLDFMGGMVVEVCFDKLADVDVVCEYLEGVGYGGV